MNSRTRVKRWLRDRGSRVAFPRRTGPGALRHVRLERIVLPDAVAKTVDASDGTMAVPLDRMVNRAGFPFGSGGWHPLIAALEEQLNDPPSAVPGSVLTCFYQRYQPATVHDVLFDGIDVPRAAMSSWPAVDRLIDIWSTTDRQVNDARRTVAAAGALPLSQFRGPMPAEEVAVHLNRLVAIHTSLAEHGYRPSSFGSRFVTGYFLTSGDQYRFVVGHGNHRVAAMSLLGHREMRVTFRKSHPPVVAEERLHLWTTAHGGLLEPHEVRAVFDRFFRDDSRERAAALGLA
jgi:hypothetical protein